MKSDCRGEGGKLVRKTFYGSTHPTHAHMHTHTHTLHTRSVQRTESKVHTLHMFSSEHEHAEYFMTLLLWVFCYCFSRYWFFYDVILCWYTQFFLPLFFFCHSRNSICWCMWIDSGALKPHFGGRGAYKKSAITKWTSPLFWCAKVHNFCPKSNLFQYFPLFCISRFVQQM